MDDASKAGSSGEPSPNRPAANRLQQPAPAAKGRRLSLGVDAETPFGPFLRAGWGGFSLSLHPLAPAAALALHLAGPGLAARYLLLLATLLLHEAAHAATALALGSRRAAVALWPVFGRALVERLPGRREAWVALAGPASNVLLAGALALCGASLTPALARAPLLDFLATVNLAMGAGNLLPLPRVDGGRALQALLRPRP